VANELYEGSPKAAWIERFAKGRFVFAGWTTWRAIKRIDVAIEAFAQVHARFPNTCLIIAGSVPDHTSALIASRDLGPAVLLAGSLSRSGIRELAHGTDCCIVPSDHDPGNNSVLEAMAAGTPVVVTRCGGSESRIVAPWLGKVVDPGDPASFASAMCDVLVGHTTYDRQAIARECRKEYSEEALAARLTTLYRDLPINSSS
jgi:glycosyltransferase involved in cell wall biosynthesis